MKVVGMKVIRPFLIWKRILAHYAFGWDTRNHISVRRDNHIKKQILDQIYSQIFNGRRPPFL